MKAEITKLDRLVLGLFLMPFAFCVSLLWSRSDKRADVITFCTPAGKVQAVASVDGSLAVVFTSISLGHERSLSLRWYADDPKFLMNQTRDFQKTAESDWSRLGFGFAAGNVRNVIKDLSGHWYAFRFPDWLPIALAMASVATCARRQGIRYRRRRRGECRNCGYDLRASPERCPECGAASANRNQFIGTADERG